MAKLNGLEKMSFAELSQLRGQVDRLMVEKQNTERVALRQKLSDMAKEHGLSLEEVLGKGRKGKGSVAPKYRDPEESGQYLDRPWPHAALDGGRDQGRQVQQGRLPDLTLFQSGSDASVCAKGAGFFPAPFVLLTTLPDIAAS